MKNKIIRITGIFAFCSFMALATPSYVYASQDHVINGPGLSNGGYMVTVDVQSVNINKEHGDSEVLTQASKGSTYHVIEDMGDGWVMVQVGDTQGFMPLDGNASIKSASSEEEEAGEGDAVATFGQATASTKREDLVNYALQFVGGRYRTGGKDPNTGADCSGFTRYVMQHGAGISINSSSGSQAQNGVPVSSEQMRPGDLIFYGSPRNINHVAMYIGNGQVVHSSTYKTGIKISNWNYRSPVKIMNVMGD